MRKIARLVVVLLFLSAAAWAQYGPNPPALCGRWSYLSSGTGRMTTRYIVLYENGTYEHYGESSTSGPNGSTASNSADSGTWRLQGNILIVNSRQAGPLQLTLILRNHPKTGDPMIIIDGDAYVTETQRPRWPDELCD